MESIEPVDHSIIHAPRPGTTGAHDLKSILRGIERDLIVSALQESGGNKAKAARALGISERLMGLRVKRLGIDWHEMRMRRRRTTNPTL